MALHQQPRVGATVHYVARGSADGRFPPVCRAAVVTAAGHYDGLATTVDLCVLNPTGLFFHETVHYSLPVADAEGVFPGHAKGRCDGGAYAAGGTWHRITDGDTSEEA
ncbi:hypothetical protein [Streptomonospora litoralis]|uniref:Uncharacterized protein n=1 Tax=Streptomonospora litoralis TaxID=2498135 RepID=A0A4P6Q8J4_9ACTN|nr:hypothetical protein [Streptomonospora litoralis]QBI56790.1 hypothetical protein EKD16_25245 [Streptomonospora litoralis]